MTSSWTREDLDIIGTAAQIDIAPARADDTVGRSTTIWVVRVGDDLYVRSYRGATGSWYRRAQRTPQGVVRAGGVERDVAFDSNHGGDRNTIDDAYRAKYGRSSYVDGMVTPDAAATTLRLLPR